MQAFIYARFSTLEQARGSSLERQLQDCRALCDRKGWDRTTDREIVDEGRSAFHGVNRAEGSGLAEFERRSEVNALGDNVVLVVERLDRLTRQDTMTAFQLISRLTSKGVAIATVDGDRLYTQETIDFPDLIEIIVKAKVAHEESEKKSHRLRAAWAGKRERAAAGSDRAMSRRCPAWIAVDDTTGRYVLRPDRAAVIQRIFQLSIEGFGKHLIAATLNREGVAPWGEGASAGNGWHSSYIQKIIGSRATIGEFQPHRKVGSQRIPEGQPLRSFYPAAIDEVMFRHANAERSTRTTMSGRRGPRIANLFSGVARCGHCGGTMTYRNKGTPSEQYLVCDSGIRHRGCRFRVHFNYAVLEDAVLHRLLHLVLNDDHFRAPDTVHTLQARQIAMESNVVDLQNQERRLVMLLSRMDENPEVERRLSEVALERHAATEALAEVERDLRNAQGQVSPDVHLARVHQVRDAILSQDEGVRNPARATVQQAFRQIIDSMECDPHAEHTTIVLLSGLHAVRFDRAGRLLAATSDGAVLATHFDEVANVFGGDDPKIRNRLTKQVARMSARGFPKGLNEAELEHLVPHLNVMRRSGPHESVYGPVQPYTEVWVDGRRVDGRSTPPPASADTTE